MWHLVAAAVAPAALLVAHLGRLDPQSLGLTTQRKAHHQLLWSSPGELDFHRNDPGFCGGLKPEVGLWIIEVHPSFQNSPAGMRDW